MWEGRKQNQVLKNCKVSDTEEQRRKWLRKRRERGRNGEKTTQRTGKEMAAEEEGKGKQCGKNDKEHEKNSCGRGGKGELMVKKWRGVWR